MLLSSFAQEDNVYSVFDEVPIQLNPGATGKMENSFQAATRYRNQWTSITPKFSTAYSVSFEGKVHEKRNSYMALGGVVNSHTAGASKLKSVDYNLCFSYGTEVLRDQYLAFGVRPTFFQRSINNEQATWGRQWDGMAFDTGMESGETVAKQTLNKFDLASGIYYYGEVTRTFSFNMGATIHHLTRPNVSFTGVEEKLYHKYTATAGAEIEITPELFSILPNLMLFKQGPNQMITVGIDTRIYFAERSVYTGYFDDSYLSFGLYSRFRDALYVTSFINLSDFSLGLSYDVNISKLFPATKGLGAFELCLVYRPDY